MSNRRWKWLCAVLATTTLYSWSRTTGVEPVSPAVAAKTRSAAYRPLRVSAAALGVSVDELVEKLLTSRSTSEMRTLAEQLGAVGDDAAIDAVRKLVSDPRPDVPDMIIRAIGAIGTDHAVDVLVELAKDPRDDVSTSAIYALGTTGSERAENFLVDLAKDKDSGAIMALGELATDRAADVLYRIAASGTDDSARTAIDTLGRMDTTASRQALSKLIDSPSVAIAAKAIESLQNVDGALLAKLTTIAKAGEPELVRPALLAIAQTGDEAIPLLRELATEGATAESRMAAVQALGLVKSPEIVATLAALVEDSSADIARVAARSLAAVDTPEARDALISAALSDRAEDTQAVDALVTMTSPEIEAALLEIAKANQYGANTALKHLLGKDSPEALDLVVARAGSSNAEERFDAFNLLAETNTETTIDKVLAIARAENGDYKPRMIETIANTRPNDPQVTQLLRESLRAANSEEQRVAAAALGKVGSDEARDALIEALGRADESLAHTALAALGSYRITDAASAAIQSAAMTHPSLLPEAMKKLLAGGSREGLRLAERGLAADDHTAMRTVQLLAESATPEANELILRAARARSDDVRATAIRALAQTRSDKAVEVVAQATRDASPGVRETAASALSSLGGDRARDALLAMTRSSDSSDRLIALQYLPDDPLSVQRAKELLYDSDSYVGYYAMRTLAASQSGSAVVRSIVLDNSRSWNERWNAARTLESYGRLDPATQAWIDRAREERSSYYD